MTEMTKCLWCKKYFEDHPFWKREIADVYQKKGAYAARQLLEEKLASYHEEHTNPEEMNGIS